MSYQNIDFTCRKCNEDFTKELHFDTPNGDYLDCEESEVVCPHCKQEYHIIDYYINVDIQEKEVYWDRL